MDEKRFKKRFEIEKLHRVETAIESYKRHLILVSQAESEEIENQEGCVAMELIQFVSREEFDEQKKELERLRSEFVAYRAQTEHQLNLLATAVPCTELPERSQSKTLENGCIVFTLMF